jgi:hypothetical protein
MTDVTATEQNGRFACRPRREPHFVGFSSVPSYIVDHHSTVPDIAVLMGFR